MKKELTRRDALKGTGAVAGTIASIPLLTRTVQATDSGNTELTVIGEIPDDSTVEITVEEYDTEGSESPLNTQTVDVTTPEDPIELEELDGEGSYYYVHDGTLTGDNPYPELEALDLKIPKGPDEYANIDFTDVLEWDEKPNEVLIEYDEWYLRQYQPQLMLSRDSRERFNGLYGYVARSEDYETDVLCYWAYLDQSSEASDRIQTGSDIGDHQPIYVFVESATGDIQKVVYSAFHWYTNTIEPTQDVMVDGRRDDRSHVVFKVTEPYNHYQFTTDDSGSFQELKSWPEVRDVWKQNGLYGNVNVESMERPWEIESEDHFWDTSFDVFFDRWYAKLAQWFGWHGADESDL